MTFSIKRPLRHALLCLLAALAPLTLPAATINVPADQKSIQAGIDAASNGDTVLVAPGTYYENIDFKGKAITVTSSAGPASTIIDGGSKPGVATVVFVTGETTSSIISKFTIRGGGDTIFAGASDGGIYVGNASATIENNTVTANTCHNIDVEFGTATILNNEVSGVLQGNSQQESYCTFGSGVHLQGTPALNGLGTSVIGNTIENNLTGSGINIWAAQNVLIMNNIIRNNTSSDAGSAFTSANSGGTALVQNLIYDNTSTCGGALGFEDGGGSASNPSILIANNTIVDNVYAQAASGSECIPIAQIYPDPYGYGSGGPGELIINNIISGTTSYPAVNCSWFDTPSEAIQPTFENDILYNGGGPFFGSYCVDVTGKYNNIVAQAQFVSPSTGDYHLKSTSPAIDKGQNSVVQTFLALTGQNFTTDFDGKPRLQDATGQGCTIDMGAYEYPGTTTDCSSTTETLTSSLNPSSFGQNVTFTAQLSSASGTPTGDVQFIDGTTALGTVAISSTGSASLSTSSLTVGSHTVTANYLPSGTLPAATATLTQVVNGIATNTNLISSLNPANVGQTVTFTATVTSATGTPTGLVTFTDGATTLGAQTLVNGVASFPISTLSAGSHNITAAYNPSGSSFAASTGSLNQVINGLPTVTSLSVAPTSAVYGSQVVMTSTVTSSGAVFTGGTLSFMDGTTVLAAGEQVVGLPPISFSTTNLTVGTHIITAVYAGDATHNASTSAPVTVTITNAIPTLSFSATPNPAFALQPIAFSAKLAGLPAVTSANTITFFANGNAIGTAQTSAQGVATFTAALPAGTYSLTAAFAGTTGVAAVTSAAQAEIVNPNPTTAAVYAQPNPGYQGGNETLTASVTTQFASGNAAPPVPTGTVTFFDSGSLIGTSNLDANGQATFATNTLAVGSHSLTAVYAGTPNFLTSTSQTYTLAILPRDFTLTTDPTITIQTQHHKDLNLTLSSVGDFTDTIALSCGNLPAYATCTFHSNGPLLAAGSTLPSTVHIDTDALLNYISSRDSAAPPAAPRRSLRGVAFALLLPVPLMAILRRRRTLRRALGLFASLFILAIATTFTGCSGHYPGHTPAGTYTFTVTGQGVATHITHTATVTLVVTE